MNETESLRARIASLESELASHYKRRAAIEAMEAYKAYAASHVHEIANEVAAMHCRYMASDESYPRTAKFLALRKEADIKREEAFA